jgi:DNA-binding CsgD family transcriptional regulator
MLVPKNKIRGKIDSKTYPLGENNVPLKDGPALALVSLSHTPLEQQIYTAMLTANGAGTDAVFTVRRLALVTDIRSLSTIRRGLEGLVAKLSVQREKGNGNGTREGAAYRVHTPEEIIAHRNEVGMALCTKGLGQLEGDAFERAISRVAQNRSLSRREAQVALCCVEGLTNAEIGSRLQVSEQTVKFHLRHIFIKFRVKRRAELISRLLM